MTRAPAARRQPVKLAGWLVLPTWLWLLVFMVFPLLVLTLIAFSAESFSPSLRALSLGALTELAQTPNYLRLIGRSLWIAFAVAVITVVGAYPVAYFVAFYAGRWRNLLLTLLIVPALSSFLLRVLAWRIILGSSGLLATFLQSLGLIETGGIPFLLYTPGAVLVTLVYVWLPFAALPIAVALTRVEGNLLEAAADLGASTRQAFWTVTLPLSMPGVVAAFLLVFIPTVGEYVTPALVGGPQGVMIGNIIWDQFARALDWPMGALLSLVLLVIILVSLGTAAGLTTLLRRHHAPHTA